jgi:hypothetical protein
VNIWFRMCWLATNCGTPVISVGGAWGTWRFTPKPRWLAGSQEGVRFLRGFGGLALLQFSGAEVTPSPRMSGTGFRAASAAIVSKKWDTWQGATREFFVGPARQFPVRRWHKNGRPLPLYFWISFLGASQGNYADVYPDMS